MKKIATLILAAGMFFGAATGASAIDFKAKGQWIMSFDYGDGGNFVGNYKSNTPQGWGKGNEDSFEARQRVRLQLDAVASESLSGTVYFEIGDTIWGKADQGGALGADGKIIELKNAYIDWMPPETDLKVRMGIQNVTLPSYTIGGSTVMAEDVAGITASYQINENVGITALWLRPFNDNFVGYSNSRNGYYNSPAGYMDNMDFGALMIPLNFDGIKVTPWGMYGAIGPNTFRNGYNGDKNDFANNGAWNTYNTNYFGNVAPTGSADGYARSGLFPVGGPRHGNFTNKNTRLTEYANAWWAGATGEFTIWDPLRIAWDFTYGSVTWDNNASLNRMGWLASLLFEYKMDWGIPGIYGWYGSGDDDDPANGSERLPTIASNNTNDFSHFAFNGDPYIARDGVISNGDMGGTWGVGIRLKDMSFIENLKHTLRVNYIGGTNSPTMAKKMSIAGIWANGMTLNGYSVYNYATDRRDSFGAGSNAGLGFNGMYLTTEDKALEVGLTNTYKMYENFTISVEADYVAMWLDTSKSVWGARHRYNQSIPSTKDAWNINASFVYSF